MAYRLRRSADFADVVRQGRRTAVAGVVVYATGGPESDDLPQVGFIVGKSVGSAVVRNTVRRRLRHVMAQHHHLLPAGAKVVVRATPDCATRSFPALDAAIGAALGQLTDGPARRAQ